jgi:predicted nucleic acid-binding protein
MILADTSVWVDHLRRANPVMIELLTANDILAHPFVIGELACGTLPDRSVLRRIDDLPQIVRGTHDEVLLFIESQGFMGRGIGYVDAHLIASVLRDGSATLWTRDRRLAQIAEELGVSHP